LAPADEQQPRLDQHLAFYRALLLDTGDCRGTRINGDELVALFANADSAFEAACAVQQTWSRPDCSPTSDQVRMLLDGQIEFDAGDSDTPAEIRVSDQVDHLIRRLPPHRIFATKVVTTHLNEALRAKFHLFEHDMSDEPNTSELYQASCYDDATTLISLPSLKQEITTGSRTLHLRWRENTITLEPDSPSLTLGRGDQSDIQIESQLASRTHARLSFQQTNFILTDQSSNGTFVQIDDDEEVYLHYEQIVLRGSGMISLGRRVRGGRGKLIYFKVTT